MIKCNRALEYYCSTNPCFEGWTSHPGPSQPAPSLPAPEGTNTPFSLQIFCLLASDNYSPAYRHNTGMVGRFFFLAYANLDAPSVPRTGEVGEGLLGKLLGFLGGEAKSRRLLMRDCWFYRPGTLGSVDTSRKHSHTQPTCPPSDPEKTLAPPRQWGDPEPATESYPRA